MKSPAVFMVVCAALASVQAAPPVLEVDEEAFFPLGWYDTRAFGSLPQATAAYAGYPSQGMNTVLFAYTNWNQPAIATLDSLNGAAANGLKLMIEVNRNAVQELPGYPLSLIDDQVDLVKSHAAFLGYYLADEPELQGMSVSMLQDRYAQIKARDPNHPIFVVHANDFGGSYLAAEPPAYTDVVMADHYVVGDGTPEFSNPMWLVAREARYYSQVAEANGKSAFISVPQAHSADGTFGLRSPTYAEQRYLSYAPIVEGARGLLYWLHFYTTEDYRANVVAPIARELQSLVPAIISNSTSVVVTSNRDMDTTNQKFIEDVTYLFGEDATGKYLIAVNNTAESFSVDFTLHADVLDTVAEVLFEDRSVVIANLFDDVWRLTDTFSPYDVNVYRVFTIPEPGCGLIVIVGWMFIRRSRVPVR